jgi:methanogenic corrinoid protein MtbC1
MADPHKFGVMKEPVAPQARRGVIARRVAEAVSEDIMRHLDATLFEDLKDAALSQNPEASRRTIKAALADGVRPEDLADFYIPALARDMGDLWCVDQLSFAGVTIGVSRLQAMMRALGPNWASDGATQNENASILLIVPQEVYHTLGAIVLSSQLRRKGFSVKLILGGKPEDIANRLILTKFEAVFISSSAGETLESLRHIIDVIRTSYKDPCPIVVGGSILDVEKTDDVTALTGADYATKRPDEALRLCGLQQTRHTKVHAKGGT